MRSIGLDIDGVIANSQPVIIKLLNSHFGKNYRQKDFTNFSPAKMFGIDRKEMDKFIYARELEIIKESIPMKGAVEAIKTLKESFGVHIISARTPSFFNHTVNWLDNHEIPYDSLMHLGHHDKRESCMEKAVGLFVEDSLSNSIQISSCGIPVYLLNSTYNQGELPDLVKRVYSWNEILSLL